MSAALVPGMDLGLTPKSPASELIASAEAVTKVEGRAEGANGLAPYSLESPFGGPNSGDEGLGSFFSDLDAQFDALVAPTHNANGGPTQGRAHHAGDIAAVRDLFAQIAANYLRPVRDFMIELKCGEAAREWAQICQPALMSIKSFTAQMDMVDLGIAIDELAAELARAAEVRERMIRDAPRDRVLAAYAPLVKLMPDIFALDEERGRREPIIIQSLLLQVPEVRKVTIDKIYAAGLTTLDVFFLASAQDIAVTTGISFELAERVVAQFQKYKRDLERAVPDATRSTEKEALTALVAQLRDEHAAYEKAASGWSEDGTDKRKLRQARVSTVLQINVVLARLGEVDRIRAIEKLPFDRKIEELERYLEDEKKKAAGG